MMIALLSTNKQIYKKLCSHTSVTMHVMSNKALKSHSIPDMVFSLSSFIFLAPCLGWLCFLLLLLLLVDVILFWFRCNMQTTIILCSIHFIHFFFLQMNFIAEFTLYIITLVVWLSLWCGAQGLHAKKSSVFGVECSMSFQFVIFQGKKAFVKYDPRIRTEKPQLQLQFLTAPSIVLWFKTMKPSLVTHRSKSRERLAHRKWKVCITYGFIEIMMLIVWNQIW